MDNAKAASSRPNFMLHKELISLTLLSMYIKIIKIRYKKWCPVQRTGICTSIFLKFVTHRQTDYKEELHEHV